MLSYLKAEHIKQKSTFTKKLIVIAPVVTLLLNALSPIWYQQNSYNWWYVMLYPGFLTLLCTLVNQRDGGKLKYSAIFTLPVNLRNIWYSKILICVVYVFTSNLILMICNIAGGYLIHLIYDIPMTISVLQALGGTLCIVLTSMWNIPFCLWLSRKTGVFGTLIVNVGMSIVLGTLGANTNYWFFSPYSWSSRLMVPILRILPNGLPATDSTLAVPMISIILVLIVSVFLFGLISIVTAKDFSRQEVI